MSKKARVIGVMGGIPTDPKLLKRLEHAAGKALTPQELKEQRISFIAGALPNKKITHDQISKVLDRIDGTRVA